MCPKQTVLWGLCSSVGGIRDTTRCSLPLALLATASYVGGMVVTLVLPQPPFFSKTESFSAFVSDPRPQLEKNTSEIACGPENLWLPSWGWVMSQLQESAINLVQEMNKYKYSVAQNSQNGLRTFRVISTSVGWKQRLWEVLMVPELEYVPLEQLWDSSAALWDMWFVFLNVFCWIRKGFSSNNTFFKLQ